ncbi:MAG: methyltransferase, partial [Rhizobiales bacterium 12-66-7]
HYPVGDVEVTERSNDKVEILATLVSTAVDAREIDAVIAEIEKQPEVLHTTWSSSTQD